MNYRNNLVADFFRATGKQDLTVNSFRNNNFKLPVLQSDLSNPASSIPEKIEGEHTDTNDVVVPSIADVLQQEPVRTREPIQLTEEELANLRQINVRYAQPDSVIDNVDNTIVGGGIGGGIVGVPPMEEEVEEDVFVDDVKNSLSDRSLIELAKDNWIIIASVIAIGIGAYKLNKK
jgi:hypothetical protein